MAASPGASAHCPGRDSPENLMLATNPFEYEHSSAHFYISGEQGKYPVTNFGELDDINLNSSS